MKYICLFIHDGGFTPRTGLIPDDLLTKEIRHELQSIKNYECDGIVQRSIIVHKDNITLYQDNPQIPQKIHDLIRKWYTIMDCKSHDYDEEFQTEWYKQTLFVMNGDQNRIAEILQHEENILYIIEIGD